MLRYIWSKIKACLWLAVGVVLLLALYTYSPDDPSINTATSTSVVMNICGVIGSYMADGFVQLWGRQASYILALFIISWSFMSLLGWGIRFRWLKIILLPILLVSASYLAALADKGGTLGFFLYKLSIWVVPYWLVCIFWVLTIIGVVFCCNIPAVWLACLLWAQRKWFLPKKARSTIKKPVLRVVVKKTTPKQRAAEHKPAAKPLQTKGFKLPDVNLLDQPVKQEKNVLTKEMIADVSQRLESALRQFRVEGKVVRVSQGPIVTLYEFEPAPGIKVERVIGLSDNLAMAMKVSSVRMSVLPASGMIGIEVPNAVRATVYIKELIDSPEFREHTGKLPVVLGKDISGHPYFADIAKMPHLLVAGTTGSGKSVGVNAMILSLLYRFTPQECRLVMIDPKMLEFSVYNDIPHLLTPVVTEPKKAVVALKWAVREMDNRYSAISAMGVRNIDDYNEKIAQALLNGTELTRRVQTGFDTETGKPIIEEQKIDLTPMPYIVIVVDEMCDLMMTAGKDVEMALLRLAGKARAAGIHLILATQRPSVDVITGTIKANFPTRISFKVRSRIDSQTILETQGAEKLLGYGDMLYSAGTTPVRIQGPLVAVGEIDRVVAYLKTQGEVHYVDAVTEEVEEEGGAGADSADGPSGGDLYEQAVDVVVRDNKPSISYVQRQLRIGYNRAADLIDRMEREGIVSAASPTGRREVLMRKK